MILISGIGILIAILLFGAGLCITEKGKNFTEPRSAEREFIKNFIKDHQEYEESDFYD